MCFFCVQQSLVQPQLPLHVHPVTQRPDFILLHGMIKQIISFHRFHNSKSDFLFQGGKILFSLLKIGKNPTERNQKLDSQSGCRYGRRVLRVWGSSIPTWEHSHMSPGCICLFTGVVLCLWDEEELVDTGH